MLNNYSSMLVKRISLIPYTLMDFIDRLPEADEQLTLAVTSGKIKVDGTEMIIDAQGKLEEVPRIWNWLFEGKNTGKLITKLAQ